ncbi:MAG: MBL fold metallo-hydrolase [Acidobacteriota bacterium]|nr:MBL fold metallo-hydrolase [Acidobacteriota bacterium]
MSVFNVRRDLGKPRNVRASRTTRSPRTAAAVLFLLLALTAAATELTQLDLQSPGAATLIVQEINGHRYHILIDTGDKHGGRIVRNYLHDQGIRQLDLVILTHMDADHARGISTLLASSPARRPPSAVKTNTIRGPPLRINAVLATMPPHEKAFVQALRTDLRKARIPLLSPTSRQVRALTTKLGLDVRQARHARTTNDQSMVITARDTRTGEAFLITGDLTRRSWQELCAALPQNPVLLQAPHHGGDPVLLEMVQTLHPTKILIAANQDNRYNHPKLAILQGLARSGRVDLRRAAQEYDAGIASATGRNAELQYLYARESGFSKFEYRLSSLLDGTTNPGTLSTLARASTPTLAALDETQTYSYEDILISGERGHLKISETGEIPMDLNDEERFHREMIWNELRYATPAELEASQNWTEMQAYLTYKVAALYDSANRLGPSRRGAISMWDPLAPGPLWLADLRRVHAGVVRSGARSLDSLIHAMVVAVPEHQKGRVVDPWINVTSILRYGTQRFGTPRMAAAQMRFSALNPQANTRRTLPGLEAIDAKSRQWEKKRRIESDEFLKEMLETRAGPEDDQREDRLGEQWKDGKRVRVREILRRAPVRLIK